MIIVRQIELPYHVLGVTLPDDSGNFIVYINRRISDEKKQETMEHEIKHITLDHFYNDMPVVQNELEAG